MDSNKIHIDELVRQRLQGGEEEPRPGAWIAMRELLDKQMPVGTRPLGGFAWGSAARWTTALVLLTLLAGGYGAMDIRRTAREGVAENRSTLKRVMTAAPRNNGNEVVAPLASNSATTSQSAGVTAAAPAGQDVTTASRASGAATSKTASSYSSNNYSSAASARNRVSRNTQPVENAAGSTATDGVDVRPTGQSGSDKTVASTRSTNTRTRKASSANTSPVSGLSATENASATKSPLNNAVPKPENTDAVATARETRRPSANRTASSSDASTRGAASDAAASARRERQARENNRVSSPAETLSSASRTKLPRAERTRAARGGGIGATKIADSIKAQVQRDTVMPIRVAHRYMSTRGVRGGRYVVDTLPSTPYIIERPLPTVAAAASEQKTTASARRTPRPIFGKKKTSSAEGLASASSAATASLPSASADVKKSNPAATANPDASAPSPSVASAAAAASETLVPLSSKIVRSTKSDKLQYSAQEQIQDVMRRTQFLFGQMRLYSGVTGGFNGSVGGTSMGGFHAGLFGLLAINDHWSVGVEGKFVQRFNRGTTLQDPYFHYRASTFNRFEQNGEAYNVYRVTTDSFDHYYKLSTLESIEFPVYARYSFHRFHAFAGANLAYGLRVKNIERVERFAGRTSENNMDTVLATAQYAPPTNTSATVKLADFGPRFGIGYTAGIGYQASPAVLVDVRMTQLVWDNKSAGAGGLRVSQTFYRVPSLQLSIGYRFSQRMGRR